ncbi:MAG: hypothetical protein SFU83_22880 [Meiothermus sp.]|nr:hypothetical protein [Meiothermus sp.]
MSNATTAHSYSAILVMDSRKVQSIIRPSSPLGGWSRLYSAGPYYLDMSFRLDGDDLRLLGRVVSRHKQALDGGTIRLCELGGHTTEHDLEPTGQFTLTLSSRQAYGLEVLLDGDTVKVGRLELR